MVDCVYQSVTPWLLPGCLFSVGYSPRPKKQLMDVLSAQHSNIRWQHCDEINAEFHLRIEERLMKETVEKSVHLMLGSLAGLVTL